MNRGQVTWAASYLYLTYLFIGEVPGLSQLGIFSVQIASVLLALLYLGSSYLNWGVATATKYLVLTWVVSYVVEYIGVSTGYPFGNYSYTSGLSPLIGPVPLFIPFLWCALGYYCLQAGGISIVAPAALMAVLDISFDPIFSSTLWQWKTTAGPSYFGVPVLNFFGWFVTAVIIFTFFWVVAKDRKRSVVLSGGSSAGVGFYFLFGVTNVISLVYGGIPQAAEFSLGLYAVVALVLWVRRDKAEGRASFVGRPESASEPR